MNELALSRSPAEKKKKYLFSRATTKGLLIKVVRLNVIQIVVLLTHFSTFTVTKWDEFKKNLLKLLKNCQQILIF